MRKISIKREQSQAGLSFAEREKFRPQVKNKLLLLLALLLTAATGAMAQSSTPSVKKLTVPNTWTGDMTTFSAADLPSDFAAVGDDVVTTIPAPTATGNAVLIYGFSGGETKYVEYANGVQSATDSRDFPRDQIYGYVNMMGYEGVYYTAAAGTASAPKHLIKATYREQTRSLEQPLPYATTIGELFEAVTGEHFSDLISTMSSMGMPLTGISSDNTSAVSIGELNGASTPVTVIADGEATVAINFGSYPLGILVSAISPLYAKMKDDVKDADKWTVKVGDGEAQALPIGGLKGDGTETVTLQYTGRLKVKGVKATSDAAPEAAAFAADEYNEASWDDTNKKVVFEKKKATTTPVSVANSDAAVTWGDGWYTVSGNVTITGNVTLTADAHLILQDGATLTINGQLDCRTNKKNLYIYGQKKGDGKLNVTNNSAIANNSSIAINSDWNYRIDIHGGEVTAASTRNIGLNTGYLAVYGGKLTATSGGGNGINFNNTIDVYGGVVEATSNATSGVHYGIVWASDDETLTVYGGKVTATGNGASDDYGNYGSGFRCYVKSGTSGIKFYFSDNGTTWGDGTSYDSATEVGTSYADAATKKRYAKATSEAGAPAEATYTLLSAATTSDCGKVVCAAGHLHDAKTAVPDGCTAVGILGKVTETGHGLILALQDATSQNWNTIDGWESVTTYAGTTLKVLPDDAARGTNLTSYTALGETAVSNWAVAGDPDYQAIFKNLGGAIDDWESYVLDNNVNAYITTGVGGSALDGEYWPAWTTEELLEGDAVMFSINTWTADKCYNSKKIRPVLGFGGEAVVAAKEPATVTTAPTGAAVVGVGKTTALVSGGVADGGMLMYAVTTTNTKPTSTDGFSEAVPKAETITASGKVYVWYYVKGDDTHSDSEIAATAIEVPVADIVWDATNVFNSAHQTEEVSPWRSDHLTYEGITISFSGENSKFTPYGVLGESTLVCYGDEGDSFTFTAPSGKNFCKIEIINNSDVVFDKYGDWTLPENNKIVWSGTAANAVTLGTVYTVANELNSIAFYLSE